MAGKSYVTKGYSTYTDIPARGGYDHGPRNPVNQYAVQTKTIDRVGAPGAGFTDFVGSPSKMELLNEYVHSPTMSSSPKSPNVGFSPNTGFNYENSSPPKFHNEGNWPMKNRNTSSPNKYHPSSPNKYHPSSPVHNYHSEEADLVRSGLGFAARQIRTGNISGTNKSVQSPPTTHHSLSTKIDNINEALGLLESMKHSPRSDPRQKGVLDELSTRAQPTEPQKRYARPAFVAKTSDVYRKYY
ncbi:unnamed protein product [Lactuca virosa]|uniref:Uncharacterized protein n=1 Tax=Lactuca virosa TaxID=75947 RepID=A0AAU9NCE0_9ASTR|nr:unnamed protein product [Lactuca virosa]